MHQGATVLSIENRKDDHIDLALKPESQGPLTTLLEEVTLIHQPLVDYSIDEINLETSFLGFKLGAPLIISAITGGTRRAYEINKALAEIAQRYRLGIGVGSQRAMIVNRDTVHTYRVVREIARDVPVIANIGIAQLTKLDLATIEWLVESIEADALAIHLNVLQELAQPEGDRDFRGSIDAIRRVVENIDVPVIVKEVGNGISRERAELLYSLGVKIVDVAGAGGTNWVSIELARARSNKHVQAFNIFKAWGLPTAISIVEVASIRELTVIGSGGIRSGLDIAKAIALGADITGMAQPFLYHILNKTAEDFIYTVVTQLRTAMLLTGSRTIEDLKSSPIVIHGKLASWICARRLRLRNTNAYIPCLTQ
uniref:Isopentenyl-diphosphate delta-isomerase n=1 Tax=Ignisphaera aggregans TaxID=334771 RepID=A0A7C2VM09_9CREN